MNILEKECEYKMTNDDKKCFKQWSSAIESLKNNVNKFYLKEENRFAKSITPLDKTIDTSILGLSFPYDLVPADDPRMIATALQIENAFNYKIGGIGRYPEDVYFGGNPWIITTLWLYMYYKRLIKLLSKDINQRFSRPGFVEYIGDCEKLQSSRKDERNDDVNVNVDDVVQSLNNIQSVNMTKKDLIKHCHKKCDELFNWALKHQYNGLSPEQIHKDLGAPISAIPLGWSHAAIIMAIHSNDYDILIP